MAASLSLPVVRRAAGTVGVALLRGALAGVPTLGVLGRLAMTGVALSNGRPPQFTLSGTLTVLLYGGAFGAALGLLVPLTRRRLPRGALGGLLLGALAMVICLPGVPPPWPRNLALFAPGFLAYGMLLVRLSRDSK